MWDAKEITLKGEFTQKHKKSYFQIAPVWFEKVRTAPTAKTITSDKLINTNVSSSHVNINIISTVIYTKTYLNA